jgi:hypothetical protein
MAHLKQVSVNGASAILVGGTSAGNQRPRVESPEGVGYIGGRDNRVSDW